MKSLRKVLDEYQPYGMSDIDVIQKYLIENGIEDQGIKLTADLAYEKMGKLMNKSFYQAQWIDTCSMILINDCDEESKHTLFVLAKDFVLHFDLSEDDRKKAATIIKDKHIRYCPTFFLDYLAMEGDLDAEITDEALVRRVKHLRDL